MNAVTRCDDCEGGVIVQIRYGGDGALDEVVGSDVRVHLEQMDAGHWWLGVDTPTGMVHVNLHARGKITATLDDERRAALGAAP